jgi:hypothetical protein
MIQSKALRCFSSERHCELCGKRLTVFGRLRDAEFCSEVHRDEFASRQQQAQLQRLEDWPLSFGHAWRNRA